MIRFTEQITTEEYMELRRKVGWMEFPAMTKLRSWPFLWLRNDRAPKLDTSPGGQEILTGSGLAPRLDEISKAG